MNKLKSNTATFWIVFFFLLRWIISVSHRAKIRAKSNISNRQMTASDKMSKMSFCYEIMLIVSETKPSRIIFIMLSNVSLFRLGTEISRKNYRLIIIKGKNDLLRSVRAFTIFCKVRSNWAVKNKTNAFSIF